MTEPSLLAAFVLGLVQGLGEFLPISSSAHLAILPAGAAVVCTLVGLSFATLAATARRTAH